ncbi:MAG TPA: hypothetical protein VL404_07760 [Candidatus Eisenbacteria bacterium]|nr:hypothetical protein [Candidatus Eisenbacteria bacterium]
MPLRGLRQIVASVPKTKFDAVLRALEKCRYAGAVVSDVDDATRELKTDSGGQIRLEILVSSADCPKFCDAIVRACRERDGSHEVRVRIDAGPFKRFP